MRVTPPPVPPEPLASSLPTPWEEGLRYRKPVFAGTGVLMTAALAVGAVAALTGPSASSDPIGSWLVPWLALAGIGLIVQGVFLHRVRTGREARSLSQSFGKSKNPGRDFVVWAGTSPLLPVLFGSMAAWDHGWALIIFATIGIAHLAVAWRYVDEALRRMMPSSAG